MDSVSKEKRSLNMRKIRSSGTLPERIAIEIFKKLGAKFTTQNDNLPGKPDIVLKNERIAIFVHGCFWHQHRGCIQASKPKTQRIYWREKLRKNTLRDQRRIRQLQRMGWRVSVLWECHLETRRQYLHKRFEKKLNQ